MLTGEIVLIDTQLTGQDGLGIFQVRDEVRYKSDLDNHTDVFNLQIVARRGYRTNFASIPWWARWLINPTGKVRTAALFHDILYQYRPVPRRLADAIMDQIMIDTEVPWLKRQLVYLALRVGGRRAFDREYQGPEDQRL